MNRLKSLFSWTFKLPVVVVTFAASRFRSIMDTEAYYGTKRVSPFERVISEAAVAWRKLKRFLLVLTGFGLFAVAEYALGRGIWEERFFLIVVILLGGVVTIFTFRYPLSALFVWVVVSPFSTYLLQTYDPKGWNFITFDSVTFFLVFVTTLFKALLNRVKPRPLLWGEALLVLFVVYVLLGIYLRGQLSLNSLKMFFFQIGVWPFIYFLVRANVLNERDLRNYATALMIATAVVTSTLFYEHFAGRSVYSLVFGREIGLAWGDVGKGRAVGPFRTPIHCAQLLVPAALLALHLMSYAKRPTGKLIYVFLALAAPLGLFFTYTRNNYVSLGICLLLAPIVCADNRKLFAMILIVTIVASALFVPGYMTGEFEKRMRAPTHEARILFMRTSLNVIKHHPIFGVGWGNSLEATKQYVVSRKQYEGIRTDSGMPLPTLVHNTYLHIAQENGLLGAGILYGGILHLCLVCWRVYRRAPDQGPLGKNFVGIIGLSFVMWFVATTAYNNDIAQYPNGLLWSYFALVTRYGQILQEKKTAIQAEEVSTGRLESGYRPRLQPGRAI